MEHWESLCPGGYRFVYGDGLFRPGTDTFLLSSLPRLKPGMRVMDLGCGTGLLGLLLLQRQKELFVTGIDIQPAAIRLAERAAAENSLEDRLAFHHADLREVKRLFSTGSFDLAVCNAPLLPSRQRCFAGQRRPPCRPGRGGLHFGGCMHRGILSAPVGRQLLPGP